MTTLKHIFTNADINGEEIIVMLPFTIYRAVDNTFKLANYSQGISRKKIVGYRCPKKLLHTIKHFPANNLTIYLPFSPLFEENKLDEMITIIGRYPKVKTIKLVDFDPLERKRYKESRKYR